MISEQIITLAIALGIHGQPIEMPQATSPSITKQEKTRPMPSKHNQKRAQKPLRTKLSQNR